MHPFGIGFSLPFISVIIVCAMLCYATPRHALLRLVIHNSLRGKFDGKDIIVRGIDRLQYSHRFTPISCFCLCFCHRQQCNIIIQCLGWLVGLILSVRPSARRSVVIVVLAQRKFQFPLELLDLESVAPQHLVSLVDVFDFGEELLEALNGGVHRLPGLLRVVLEVDGSDRVLDVVDAEACLHEQILELVQPGLDLLGRQRGR
mmetsp:Transcript_14675/g.34017  ORF Transcript_14675/g.34017 Transcript_14675/m.34017 type:complete len:203 (+) Transcript_14675:124-732(+)